MLALKARLDGVLQGGRREGLGATDALTAVVREQAALRECLGVVEQVSGATSAAPGEIIVLIILVVCAIVAFLGKFRLAIRNAAKA